MRNLVSIEDLDRSAIERILELAANIGQVADRPIKKLPSLRGRLVINLFYEASTRTRSSFELAAKRLSADVLNLVTSGSSVEKGESLRDTVATLSAYGPDAIVIRSPHAGAPALLVGWTRAAVINAGDGKHQHPTQALLDCYTLIERLGSLEGCNIWIVGDVLHSRVARSCIQAFRMLGAQVTVAGPPTLVPDEFAQLGASVEHSLERMREADVVYALRMQLERMEDSLLPSLREYTTHFQVNSRRLGPRQLLMHPGPVNRGIELSGDVIDSPQSLITDQVAAGVVVRMAVLYEVLAGAPPESDSPDSQSPALEPQTA
ncbi:MAG: aspartate carbamoyltransferase catalytic subunit [Solirubrobacteraceae bacterium]|jgi:aspartate carbamoyltransferase catalytic subunit